MLRHARERRPPVGDIQAPTLALAYAPGQHDELLAVECIIDARALMPAETGGGDERLQHGDGAGHHGGGAPRY